MSRGRFLLDTSLATLAVAVSILARPLPALAAAIVPPPDGSTSRNLALDSGVTATAQSTFPGYAPSNVIDGNTDTKVGSATSWANAHSYGPDGRLPQWLEVALPVQRVIEGITLYTSAGYVIKDYDAEFWADSAWQPLLQQRGNGQTVVNHSFPAITARRIRIVGRRGPDNQPSYVRINELQILGHDTPRAWSSSVLDAGSDWQRVEVEGDDADGAPTIHEVLAVLKGGSGVANAPIPQSIKDDLAGAAPTDMLVVSDTIAQEIAISEAQGALTPRLLEIAEPPDETDETYDESARALGRGCSDKLVTKGRSVNFNGPFSSSPIGVGAFEGSFEVSGGVKMTASVEARFARKRFKLIRWCIPYGYRFLGASVSGQAEVDQGSSFDGKVNYPKNWEWDIANIDLGGETFFIGPVPVYLDFDLPITAGVELSASATGTVRYNGAQAGIATFQANCDPSCTASGDWNFTRQPDQPLFNAGISARIQATPWVQAAFKVSVYHEAFLFAQVGVRPKLETDIWGYAGNTCGDADQSGGNESVSALTVDLDGSLYLTGEVSFLKRAQSWDDLWHIRGHILFADLLSGSTALQPMVAGPVSTPPNTATSYGISMRPCWPYNDQVEYRVEPQDGATQWVKGPAHDSAPVSLLWSTIGSKSITARALADDHGRDLNAATTRSVQVVAGGVNLARSATASASSTYWGYAASRVNDGSRNTTVGGPYSWTNAGWTAPNGSLPQWVQLDFGTNKTFSKVEVYTSSGYPIRDFDVQYWDSFAWVTVVTVNANTALHISPPPFTPVTARLVRIYARGGPTNQPSWARVNEFEVY
jgi:hypothetical protein